jgi:hypothetical protein
MSDHHHNDEEDPCHPEDPEQVIGGDTGVEGNDPVIVSLDPFGIAPIQVRGRDMVEPPALFRSRI